MESQDKVLEEPHAEEDDTELYIDQQGHKKWLCAIKDGYEARVRLPLHVELIADEEKKQFVMGELCFKLKTRLMKRQGVKLAPN